MFAAASALIALLLIVIALMRTRTGAKSGTSANWVFGGLFLIAAFVLWNRGSEQTAFTTQSQEEITESISDSSIVNPSSRDVKHETSPAVDAVQQEIERSQIQTNDQQSASGKREAVNPSQSKQELNRRPSTARTSHTGTLPPVTLRSANDELSWEDRIYSAVNASFEWIEEFFEKYATTVSTERSRKSDPALATTAPAIDFPAIEFAAGTADMSRESIADLKKLASLLSGKFSDRTFEIQAYVDSIGPEAFNFVLTQARADAVRDLLIAEGVDENHLIARGYGTGKDPEYADARIEFIVR